MGRLHPSAAEGFQARADTYVAGRPDYPPDVAAWVREDLGLTAGTTAVELGAGTGKFTPNLLAAGARVIAVEPVAAMRAHLVGRFPEVDARDGTAESIPADDASADAVVCAQSFHWFANHAALAEIRRVLKPGGALGLIWNVHDERVPWVAEVGRIIASYTGDEPQYRTGAWRRVFPADGFGPLRERVFRNHHRGTAQNVVIDRVLSTSFIAALPAAEQANVVARVQQVIDATPELAGQDTVVHPYVTHAFAATKTDG